MRSFLRGVAEALAVVAAFVGLGLGWAGIEAAARDRAPLYPGPVMIADETRGSSSGSAGAPVGETPVEVWLVDGYNLLNVAMLRGAERDRFWTGDMQARVVEQVERLDAAGAECWVVFDATGRDPEGHPDPGASSRVRVAFAPSADDWLVRRVKAATDPARVTVVTADRRVADRARHHGAAVMPPRDFVARCAGGRLDPAHREPSGGPSTAS